MKHVLRLFSRAAKREEGITGLETAIILIAFVVVATVFAFVVLTTGIFSSERGKETVFAGLQKARGTAELRGGVVATAVGTVVDDIQFALSPTAGGEPVPINPAAGDNRTVLAFRDSDSIDNDVTYTVTDIVGDSDTLLEPGELKLINVDRATGIDGPPDMEVNERFTIEVQTPVGAVLDITRQLPPEMNVVMQLH